MNIRKFFSIFDRNKEAPVAKPKRRKAKAKAVPKKGHWKYTGIVRPDTWLIEPVNRFGIATDRDLDKTFSVPEVGLLTIQDLTDALDSPVSSSDITAPSTKPSPSHKKPYHNSYEGYFKPSTLSPAQKIMITSARYVEDEYDLARKDPKNYEWVEE